MGGDDGGPASVRFSPRIIDAGILGEKPTLRAAPEVGRVNGGRSVLEPAAKPHCIQSDVEWYEDGDASPDIEFVLQGDSDDKVGFADGGIFYVGYRTESGTWHATWQCA